MAKHDPQRYLNKKFLRLTPIKLIGTMKVQQKDRLRTKYLYLCECECGNTKTITSCCLGYTKSCGCAHIEGLKIGHEKQRGMQRPSIRKASGESVFHSYFLSYKRGAKNRNLAFEIDKDFFREVTSKHCHYFDAPPKEFTIKGSYGSYTMNGIDRVDSNAGYIEENCVPCCKICNYMKLNWSVQEWMDHMRKVLDFYR